ncbi:Protein SEY1 [Fusarium oxysporum f. sp. albedinis]|nr:Protein SEY1 [Fusarium oxysporum f. sp. albedinis]
MTCDPMPQCQKSNITSKRAQNRKLAPFSSGVLLHLEVKEAQYWTVQQVQVQLNTKTNPALCRDEAESDKITLPKPIAVMVAQSSILCEHVSFIDQQASNIKNKGHPVGMDSLDPRNHRQGRNRNRPELKATEVY